jgi:acetyltransferase
MSLRTFLLGGYWPDPYADPAVITTAHGPLSVRPLTAADAALARAFVDGLSPESRYYRFFQSFRTIPPILLERLVAIDPAKSMALVAVAAVDGKPKLVGEARYCLGEEADDADFAVAVDDHWQGLGIGRGLLERLEQAARGNGIHHLKGEVMAANDKMLQFARNRGFQIWPDEEDRRLLRIAKTLIA